MRRAAFLDPLRIEPISASSYWVRLLAELRFRDEDGIVFTVPEDFVCDLASVPKFLRSLAMDWRLTGRSGSVHDCAYKWAEIWGLTRRQADALYYRCLRADGANRVRAYLQWSGIRAGGWAAWRGHRHTPVAHKGVRPAAPTSEAP